ncbi:MAG: SDR family oxidoreductase [Fimbriimonadaceae bacterium]|nr:SDR family oxidoreductase [Fimbriimonadaceae bacterium]
MSQPHVLDLFRLDGRVALITGGSRGLGKSIALGFAQAGATCVLAGRDAAVASASASELSAASGQTCHPCVADVTDEADVARMVEWTLTKCGRLDILVNSAGINIRHPIEEFALAEFQRVVETNLTGTWLACRAVAAHFKAQGSGSVINLGSALSAVGLAERSAYCSSKAAVIGLTKTLALEWAGSGARCNAICPGPFLTEMNLPLLEQPERAAAVVGLTALNRWAELPEIRGAALYLASDAASYVTGTTLFVDGGWTAR